MSARVCSFAPVARPDARLLILGSMPGTVSLAAHQYYAHPHNQFWRIMGELCGAGPELPYEQRLERLQARGIGLWDVFESCARPGSLDSSIDHASAVVNDIPALLRRCPQITRICCNGTTSYTAFNRHLGAELARSRPSLEIQRLPSTSPANASWSPARKLAAWRAALSDGCRIDPASIAAPGSESTAATVARYSASVRTRRLPKLCP
jgi:double-stranded uracil-DNA glycosylase